MRNPAATRALLNAAHRFHEALGVTFPDRTTIPAAAAYRAMVDVILYRDLERAMAASGVEFSLADFPKRYTEQSDWRDYCGWLCTSERMASWVAAWIARYLDPRDSDGNPMRGRVNAIRMADGSCGWLAVSSMHKVAD